MSFTSSTVLFGINAFILVAMLGKDGLLEKVATNDRSTVIAYVVLAAIPGFILYFSQIKDSFRKRVMSSSIRKLVALLPHGADAYSFIPVSHELPDDGELVIMAWLDSSGELLRASEGFVIDGVWKSRGDLCDTPPDAWLPLPKTH